MPAEITLGQSLLPLFHNRDPFILVEGPRGTGKTRAILSVLMCRALEYPGSRIMLARSTRTRLSQTVLETLEKQVFPAFGLEVPGSAGAVNRTEYRLPNGSVFIPVGLDDQQRSQSAEFAWIYVAEGVEIDTENDVAALAGALRQAGVPFHQCIIDCNPGAPGHWLNKKAEDVPNLLRHVHSREDYDRLQEHNQRPANDPLRRWKRLITKHQDNPYYFDVERWEWTKPGEDYVKTTLGTLVGHLKLRWVDGFWKAAEGTVFPEFDDEIHVIKPIAIPDTWPCWWFHDAGYDHPAANLLLCKSPTGRAYLIDEWYGGGRRVPEHAKWIKSRNEGRNIRGYRADPRDCFKEIEQGPSIAKQFEQHGLKFEKYPLKSGVAVQHQVELVSKALTTLGEDGKPMFQIFDTCTGTIMELQTWAYARSAAGEQKAGDDAYEDKHNHAIDCLLGFFASNLTYEPQKIEAFGGLARPSPVLVNGKKRYYDDADDE